MAEFVLNRNHVLAANGHRISFTKGKPTWVPPMLHRQAAAIGAERVDGVEVDPLEAEKKNDESAPLTAEERIVELVTAIEMICEKNDSGDFGGDNRPTLEALHKVVGFTTSKKELDKAWKEYKAKAAE